MRSNKTPKLARPLHLSIKPTASPAGKVGAAAARAATMRQLDRAAEEIQGYVTRAERSALLDGLLKALSR